MTGFQYTPKQYTLSELLDIFVPYTGASSNVNLGSNDLRINGEIGIGKDPTLAKIDIQLGAAEKGIVITAQASATNGNLQEWRNPVSAVNTYIDTQGNLHSFAASLDSPGFSGSVDFSGVADFTADTINAHGYFAYGSTAPEVGMAFDVTDGADKILFRMSDVNVAAIDFNGRLGIGTTTPTEALTVVGNYLGNGTITTTTTINDYTLSTASIDPNLRHLIDTDGTTTVASWGGFSGYLVAPQFAADTILNAGGGSGLSVLNKYLIDSSGQNSLDWGNRYLVDQYGLTPVQWGNRSLLNTSNQVTVDWSSCVLSPDGMVSALVWSSYELRDSGSITSANWSTRYLIDNMGFTSVNWQDRVLNDNAGAITVDYQNSTLINQVDNYVAVDWFNYLLYDSSVAHVASLDWNARLAYYASGNLAINYATGELFSDIDPGTARVDFSNSYYLRDSSSVISLRWNDRKLYNTSGVETADWENGHLRDAAAVRAITWTGRGLYNGSNALVAGWGSSNAFYLSGTTLRTEKCGTTPHRRLFKLETTQ
jgi:hypothetical protein